MSAGLLVCRGQDGDSDDDNNDGGDDDGDNDDDADDVDIIMTMMTVMMSVMGFSPSSAGLEVCLGQNPRGARYSHHIFCYTLDV